MCLYLPDKLIQMAKKQNGWKRIHITKTQKAIIKYLYHDIRGYNEKKHIETLKTCLGAFSFEFDPKDPFNQYMFRNCQKENRGFYEAIVFIEGRLISDEKEKIIKEVGSLIDIAKKESDIAIKKYNIRIKAGHIKYGVMLMLDNLLVWFRRRAEKMREAAFSPPAALPKKHPLKGAIS